MTIEERIAENTAAMQALTGMMRELMASTLDKLAPPTSEPASVVSVDHPLDDGFLAKASYQPPDPYQYNKESPQCEPAAWTIEPMRALIASMVLINRPQVGDILKAHKAFGKGVLATLNAAQLQALAEDLKNVRPL